MTKENPTKKQASKAGTKLASHHTTHKTKSNAASTLSNYGHKESSSKDSHKK